MTEAEWLAATLPKALIHFVINEASDRKLRLFMVSCCRRDIEMTERQRDAIDVAERLATNEERDSFTDGKVSSWYAYPCYPNVKAISGSAYPDADPQNSIVFRCAESFAWIAASNRFGVDFYADQYSIEHRALRSVMRKKVWKKALADELSRQARLVPKHSSEQVSDWQ